MKSTRTTFAALDAALARVPNRSFARDASYTVVIRVGGKKEKFDIDASSDDDARRKAVSLSKEKGNTSGEVVSVLKKSGASDVLDAALARVPNRARRVRTVARDDVEYRGYTLKETSGRFKTYIAVYKDGKRLWVGTEERAKEYVDQKIAAGGGNDSRDASELNLSKMSESQLRQELGDTRSDLREMDDPEDKKQARADIETILEELERRRTGGRDRRAKDKLDAALSVIPDRRRSGRAFTLRGGLDATLARGSRTSLDRLDAALARVPDRRRHARDSFGTYKPTDVLKRGDKVRVNMQGEPVEEVMSQEGTQVYFYSGRHAHITNLVPAK